ncbi:MAG: hypothetical protein LUP97_07180 [Methanoregula sp.]|nr:hypothetical protein [Methanoregula sp.]
MYTILMQPAGWQPPAGTQSLSNVHLPPEPFTGVRRGSDEQLEVRGEGRVVTGVADTGDRGEGGDRGGEPRVRGRRVVVERTMRRAVQAMTPYSGCTYINFPMAERE